jgi:RimJ/RimL family protein N-acetyltransferase
MEPADAEAQHRWRNDPDVTVWTGWRYPIARAAIAQRIVGPMSFANPRFSVERLDTGELVGYTALRDVTPESRNGELDLVIGERSAWGQGFGTDTARTICAYAFERIGLHRVQLWVVASHAPAIRAYEKAGFVPEGVARQRFYKRGAWHDALLMARLAPGPRP